MVIPRSRKAGPYIRWMVQQVLGLRRFSVADTWLMQRFGQWKISKICRFKSNSGPLLTAGTRPKKIIYFIDFSFVSLPGWTSPVPKKKKKKKNLFRSEDPRGYSNGFLASWCILWLVSRRQDKLTETKEEKKLHDISLNMMQAEKQKQKSKKQKAESRKKQKKHAIS